MELPARTRLQCCQSVRGAPLCCGSLQHPLRRLSHLLFLLLLYSLTSCSNGITAQTKKESSVPLLAAIPDTSFRCLGHSAGYYADPDTGCQVYHMCDTLERQYSYLCPNYTLFNQKFMVCDHWYMVDCATSHTFYHLNGHIGEVPEKGEGEEQQNAITVRPEEGISTKKNKATPARATLSGSAPLSSRHGFNRSSGSQSEDPKNRQSEFGQPGAQPRNTTVHESPKKLDTPITPAVTPSIINPTSSSRKQFVTSLTVPSSTPTPKPVTQSTRLTIKPQAFIPTKQPSTPLTRQETNTPARTPFSPTRTTVTQPVRQPTTPHRAPFIPESRQSFISPTKQPFTSLVTQSSSQPSRQPVTQATLELTTEATVLPEEISTTPASFITTPKTKFKDSNVEDHIIHTQTEIPFFSVTKNPTLPSSTKARVAPEGEIPAQTEQPGTGLNMMPSSVARSPGNRFSFTSHKVEEPILTPEELQRIVFQPLLVRPRTKTRRILSNAPSLLPIDPANSSDAHHHLFPLRIEFHSPAIPEDSSSRDSLDLKLSNSQRVQTPNLRLQPPSETTVSQPLSAFLSPPKHPFTPITGMKQEFPTLLEIPPETDNLRTSPRDTFLPGARRLPFPPPSHGNRDFFIPSAEFSLLVSEVPLNNVEERVPNTNTRVSRHHQDHHGSHMTMLFPAPIEPSRMEELRLNPECPRCHPEFLKPGQCHPCVVIK